MVVGDCLNGFCRVQGKQLLSRMLLKFWISQLVTTGDFGGLFSNRGCRIC